MIKLVKIEKSDYPALYGFMYDTWMDTFSSIIPAAHVEFVLHKYFDEDNIKKFEKQGYQYFYIHDGEKAGLIVYVDKGSEIYLDKIYVLKGHRGKSYASFAINVLKRMGKDLTLNVNRNNTHAIDVYKHMGFEVEKEVDIQMSEGMINQDYFMRCPAGK